MSGAPPGRDELYETAIREFGRALDRLAAGYEADPEKRHDLRQDIHLQLWRSFGVFDGRCSRAQRAAQAGHRSTESASSALAAHPAAQTAGFAAVIAWVIISLYRCRRRIWRRNPSRPDAMAATGLEYYCRQLEQRRDHLRDAWLWHGTLFLACTILIAILIGKASPATVPLRNVLPLVVLLVAWTGFGLVRRRRQAP